MRPAEIKLKNQSVKECDVDCRGECCQGVGSHSDSNESESPIKPNPYRYFSRSYQTRAFAESYVQSGFFTPRLKPLLTEVEKEILNELRLILGLTPEEFKAKLNELNIHIGKFARSLKENLFDLKMGSPKDLRFFFDKMVELNLLPAKLLEKLRQEYNPDVELEDQAPSRRMRI